MFSSRVVPDRVRFPALLELELEPTNQPRSGDEITEGALAKKKSQIGVSGRNVAIRHRCLGQPEPGFS